MENYVALEGDLLKNTFTVGVKGDSDFSRFCSKCKSDYKNGRASDMKSTLSYIPYKDKLKPHCVLFLMWYIYHAQMLEDPKMKQNSANWEQQNTKTLRSNKMTISLSLSFCFEIATSG